SARGFMACRGLYVFTHASKYGNTFYVDKPFGICECGSVELDLRTGQELNIKEIEVEELCV
ncbi:MAG: hypothetical protein ACKPE3_29105, partial [Sphaerospermopsis kisseleviana]